MGGGSRRRAATRLLGKARAARGPSSHYTLRERGWNLDFHLAVSARRPHSFRSAAAPSLHRTHTRIITPILGSTFLQLDVELGIF